MRLTKKQAVRTKTIYDKMRQEAVTPGKLLFDKDRMLDDLFATGQIDKPQVESVVSEIARLQDQLRAAHLRAHLQMKVVPLDEQISRYDEQSGYESGKGHDSRHHP